MVYSHVSLHLYVVAMTTTIMQGRVVCVRGVLLRDNTLRNTG